MPKKNAVAELEGVQAAIRRWQTRLTKAVNMLNKLERKRRRLEAKAVQVLVNEPPIAALPQPAEIKRPATSLAGIIDDLGVEKIAEKLETESKLSIPDFLDRSNPAVAEEMTRARRAKEAEARKQMPLTGKAALDAIKPRRKAVNVRIKK